MLNTEPDWKFRSKKPLTQWYGHVHLLKENVVGQWFCVDRVSGKLKWQRYHHRVNSICGIESGVIVAEETRSDGLLNGSFGCYGLSLATGKLLWVSHGAGFWGTVGRILDFVPGFTNEFRDNPLFVKNGKVFCSSGRVLDVITGRQLERISRDEIQLASPKHSDTFILYRTGTDKSAPKVRVENILLFHPPLMRMTDEWILIAETVEGEPVWKFDIRDCERYFHAYSYKLTGNFIYLIVSEQKHSKPDPNEKHRVLPNPTRWAILTLDVFTGKIVQEISLGDELLEKCKIEDTDEDGLLIGKSNNELMYFSRTG